MRNETDPMPTFNEKLVAQYTRQRNAKTGELIRHSRWNKHSKIPRYTNQQETWFYRNLRADGWRNGARVVAQ